MEKKSKGRDLRIIRTRKAMSTPFISLWKKIQAIILIFGAKFKVQLRRNARKDSSFVNNAVKIIDRIDENSEEFSEKADEVVKEGEEKVNAFKQFLAKKPGVFVGYLTGIVVVSLGLLVLFNNTTAYEYSYNDRPLGLVKNQSQVIELLPIVEKELKK
ncbi:MAG: hypothetical protein ACRCUS_10165, partial [Anaerovoracaceae bacterium]